jgi:hypothetical protein
VRTAPTGSFARLCRLIGGLSGHPHVVTVHDSGLTDDQRPFIVMQYYACGSLADVVARDGHALAPTPATQ